MATVDQLVRAFCRAPTLALADCTTCRDIPESWSLDHFGTSEIPKLHTLVDGPDHTALLRCARCRRLYHTQHDEEVPSGGSPFSYTHYRRQDFDTVDWAAWDLPDSAVVPGSPRDYHGRHPTTAALVVEVADTTLTTDTTEKAERYVTAGVADYWVLDVDGRRLLVFRDPAPLPAGLGATAYRTCLALGPADTVAPLAAPNNPVAVADLLP